MSEDVAASIADYGIDRDRITTVGGGANLPIAPSSVAGRAAPVVLFVGGDLERKGGDLLIDAFARIQRQLPEAELWLAGLGLTSSAPGVRFLGRIGDRAALRQLYRSARVLALPARHEPYGLVLVEAMSQGVPCVGSAVGAIPEIVLDGVTGTVVPPEDADALAAALLPFLRDPATAERAGTAAIQRVTSTLTWDHVADRMVDALHLRLRTVGDDTPPSLE